MTSRVGHERPLVSQAAYFRLSSGDHHQRRSECPRWAQQQTRAAQKIVIQSPRPSSVAGRSMPSALTFENIGMLPVFNPEVCNGWSLADIAEHLAHVRFNQLVSPRDQMLRNR
jgi:hypothetical protein